LADEQRKRLVALEREYSGSAKIATWKCS